MCMCVCARCVCAGEDFDQRVMEYFIKLIKKKYKADISKDARALQKLRREAERAKRALSSQHQVGGGGSGWYGAHAAVCRMGACQRYPVAAVYALAYWCLSR